MTDPAPTDRECLSSTSTPFYRATPIVAIVVGPVFLLVGWWHHSPGILWLTIVWLIFCANAVWYGRRLSIVWRVGDTLEVTGPASFRVSLANVLLLESGSMGRGGRLVILGLDPPIGNTQEIRFIPFGAAATIPDAGDRFDRDLQTRIHAARAART